MFDKLFKFFEKEKKTENLTVNEEQKTKQATKHEELYPYQRSQSQSIVEHLTYGQFINLMAIENWMRTLTFLTEKSSMVAVNQLKKEEYGIFLETRCPAGMILTFPCIKQVLGEVNMDIFRKYPNLYPYPYSFNIRCKNSENDDMHWSRMVDIEVIHKEDDWYPVTTEFYDDLSIKSDTRYKRLEERYYLKDQGIILYGEEILRLKTIPDIDITTVELFAKADLWRKY
jgi:hypothetical protein